MKNSARLKQAMHYISQNKFNVDNKYRLKFHLMGECGWINDPNGFIFYNDWYHCFFQYNPFEPFWGPTYWGHAVSKDLVKWDYLPIALAPDKEYDKSGCFSGSAIEKDGKLYLMYTGHVEDCAGSYYQTQCIAYSEDGISFEKYFKNPVINTSDIPEQASKNDFRDPKAFKKGDFYYAVIASQSKEGKGQVLLYKSSDLLKWEYVNTIIRNNNIVEENIWECPDLFEFGEKDILLFSAQQKEGKKVIKSETFYCVGKMNFKSGLFHIDYCEKLDWGKYFYAPHTTVDKKGRRLMIAWMDNWNCPFPTQEGHNWAGALILPRELYLRNNKLFMKPVDEIKKYRKEEIHVERVLSDESMYLNCESECMEIESDLFFITDAKVEINIFSGVLTNNSVKILYDSFSKKLKFIINDLVFNNESQEIDLHPIDNKVNIRFLLDKSSIELFINEGEKVLTNRIYPLEKYNTLSISSKGTCKVNLKKWNLNV
ncbi:glycoside hydrolase family 32 protein [Caldicellulosiruptor naganoensis]|uniref:Sucrose-6-phosphate hydrolase n=1 Tax=Caldicellulosiruptor naganoensis TaxID=29324 RepID=A0ABY7BFW1_9FIRM|nr:glycoside hydrolase family 32 protein [Caldicellulosiruptor naganoensis]WAM31303.1 glycoside hydrolase family 32 protein [Caldicellulosiruptor naganoensis]